MKLTRKLHGQKSLANLFQLICQLVSNRSLDSVAKCPVVLFVPGNGIKNNFTELLVEREFEDRNLRRYLPEY